MLSDLKAKMHQNQFPQWLRPRPCWGNLQHSPDPLAGFKGPISKERGKEGEGRNPHLALVWVLRIVNSALQKPPVGPCGLRKTLHAGL